MQGLNRPLTRKRLTLAVAAASLAAGMNAHALDFEFKDGDITVDWDTQVSYGVMWRVQSAAPNWDNLLSSYNTNDGTLNFETGIASNKISIVSEADINWGNFGFFVRGKALYDYRYQNQDTDMSRENYQYDNSGTGDGQWSNELLGGLITVGGPPGDLPREDFHDDTKDIHGKDAFFLDAFLYGDFELGDRLLGARLGRQVISWGESQFFPNTSGAQSHADASAAAAPGTQVKEIYLPVGALYGNMELSPAIAVEAYYQYEWKKAKEAGVGSYWSNADISGAGAERMIIFEEGTVLGDLAVPVPVVGESEPDGTSEEAQWGLAIRYFMENGTELGFYRLRYHNKYPSFYGATDTDPDFPHPQVQKLPKYMQAHYQEDIDLYAMSFSTLFGDVNVVGELSYSPNSLPTQQVRPVADEDGEFFTNEFQTGHVTQANLGLFYIWGKTPFADQINLIAEAVYIRSNLEENVPNYNLNTGDLMGYEYREGVDILNDDEAWGYTGRASFEYKSVRPGLDLSVITAFKHSPKGSWKEVTLTEGAKEASLGLDFKYLNNWKGGIKYSTFWGAKDIFTKHDRDNISLSVTYSF